MKTLFSLIFVFLAYTCWLWPILFVVNLLKCIKGIVQQKAEEEYQKNVTLAIVSLICICISPFVISLLVTA